jgi:hypothetical protein
MSNEKYNRSKEKSPPSVEQVSKEIRSKCEKIIHFCTNEARTDFYKVEQSLQTQLYQLGCLFMQLVLISCQTHFEYSDWLEKGLYNRGKQIGRTIKTRFGKVRYWRTYLINKKGGGFYPLDSFIGLTSDGFSPLVISLATKLSTRMSFSASVLIFKKFLAWSPSSEAIQGLVLGMGKSAAPYMEQREAPQDDGEILIIEVDGKATPTATANELEKRRGKRKNKTSCCTRHRNKTQRRNSHKKAKNQCKNKDDKRKNGRSITLVVMYTLKRDQEGKLHGPINKLVWGSYAPRKVMLAWARRQASKRGFPPDTQKRVHIVIDGEICLYDGLVKLFHNATFALDIRHLEAKCWNLGRTFHKSGSKELLAWMEDKIECLYTGKVTQLITEFKKLKLSLSSRAKRDKEKREKVSKLINYMEKRPTMMNYKQLLEEDMVIASGIVEGAARYVVGERMDCGGMRWIPERAEALLKLRCIELNGDWEHFFNWGYQEWIKKMRDGEKLIIRSEIPDSLDTADSYHDDFFSQIETDEIQKAA